MDGIHQFGRYERYVQSFPASGGKGKFDRRWRFEEVAARRRELFSLSGDNLLMAVEVKAGATFEFGVPKALFEAWVRTFSRFYTVTGDGQRFLINSPVAETAATQVTVGIITGRPLEAMTVAAGRNLGRYEIRSQLGAGGMGEVYRARGTQMGRDVAIKVLPPAFSEKCGSSAPKCNKFQ